MTKDFDVSPEKTARYFAALDQARAEADAREAAFAARMHAHQQLLATDMPRLLGITLPEGVHFEWKAST